MNSGIKQILAIFRKDARHLWAEIAISLALQVALVILYPRQWRVPGAEAVSSSFGGFATHAGATGQLLVLLLPVSWWVLLARLVHTERLAGDTQFWITRPYRWPLLLSAKLLFVAAFVYLPLLIAQSILLGMAGFNPLAHVPGLLFNAFLLSTFLILPLLALSALTSNIARMTLTVLGVLLYFAGVSVLAGLVPRLASSPALVSGSLFFALLLCGAGAIILVQYARRRTRTAWSVLAAMALLLGSTAFYDIGQPFVNRAYPPLAENGTAAAQFTYGLNAMSKPVAHGTAHSGFVEVAIPVHITGISAGSVVIPAALKVTLDVPGNALWESPWRTTTPEKLLPGSSDTVFRFAMPRQIYEQFRNAPASLRITFAVDQAHAVRNTTIALPGSRFEVPGFGMCTPITGWDGQPITIGIGCLSPLRQPDLTYITAQWRDNCHSSDSNAQSAITGYGWAGSLDSAPADFNLVSVWQVPMSFTNSWRYSDQLVHMRQLCPGAPLSFTTYKLESRTRIDLSVPDFRLPELSQATQAEYQTR
jgi:hypothetical protein